MHEGDAAISPAAPRPARARDTACGAASEGAIPVRALWAGQHLDGLRRHLADTIGPALELSAMRRRPWWR